MIFCMFVPSQSEQLQSMLLVLSKPPTTSILFISPQLTDVSKVDRDITTKAHEPKGIGSCDIIGNIKFALRKRFVKEQSVSSCVPTQKK